MISGAATLALDDEELELGSSTPSGSRRARSAARGRPRRRRADRLRRAQHGQQGRRDDPGLVGRGLTGETLGRARAQPRAAGPPGPARADRGDRAGDRRAARAGCRPRSRRTRTSRSGPGSDDFRPGGLSDLLEAAAPCGPRCARDDPPRTPRRDCAALQPLTAAVLARCSAASSAALLGDVAAEDVAAFGRLLAEEPRSRAELAAA